MNVNRLLAIIIQVKQVSPLVTDVQAAQLSGYKLQTARPR